jgi:heme A synthase
MLAVGASGAVTALGDTLFPAPSLSIGIAQDFAPGANAFVRLRVVHPMIACVTALGVVVASGFVRAVKPTSAVRRFSHAASGLAMAQVAAGLLDIVTGAPVSVQLVHLGLADAVWIALVLLAAAALEDAQEFVSAPRADAFATLG